MRRYHAVCMAGVVLAVVGCGDAPREQSGQVTPGTRGEGGSPVSLDSALTIFRRDMAPVTELETAETSIDAVVRKLVVSVEASDTAALRALVMSRREFAYLYYPTSPFTRSPTKQEPGLVWFLHMQNSQKGATRLLNSYGGRELRIARNKCNPPARSEGDNVLWGDCVQTIVVRGDTLVTRLFGGVYERNGRFKIFSYSNDL